MPCYDPPPPWQDRQRWSAEEAVRILCHVIGQSLDAGLLTGLEARRPLEWYLEHRKIDLEIATNRDGYGLPDAAEADKIRADLGRVEALLAG